MTDATYLHIKQTANKKDEHRQPYEKPVIIEEKEMTFMFDAIEAEAQKSPKYIACRQCSSCHGCR